MNAYFYPRPAPAFQIWTQGNLYALNKHPLDFAARSMRSICVWDKRPNANPFVVFCRFRFSPFSSALSLAIRAGGPFSPSSSLWVTREWSPKMPAINWRRKKEGGTIFARSGTDWRTNTCLCAVKDPVFFSVIRVALCHRRTLEYAVCVQCF